MSKRAICLIGMLIVGSSCADQRARLLPTKNGDVIGTATMTGNREVLLDLRSVTCDGTVAEGRVSYKPDDPNYLAIVSHIGGLAVGEVKPVLAWPSEPCRGR